MSVDRFEARVVLGDGDIQHFVIASEFDACGDVQGIGLRSIAREVVGQRFLILADAKHLDIRCRIVDLRQRQLVDPAPLRLIEEIAMLDHLSHGRLEVGVGRGVSPFELNFHKVNHDQSRDIFLDAYECIVKGLTSDELNHSGPFFSYSKVPMALKPLQKPYPPVWYASSAEFGSRWAGERGLHFGTLGSVETAKKNIDAYKDAYAKRGTPAHPKPEFPGGVVIGVKRQLVVADTDADARKIAEPAHEQHHEKIMWLLKRNVTSVNYTQHIVGGFDAAVKAGAVIAGTPDTVRAEIERQVKALGVNHMNFAMFFGNMTLENALRSQRLFAKEVMPTLASL